MPDNVNLPGTGLTVATELIGVNHYQRSRINIGSAGTSQDLVKGPTTIADSIPVSQSSTSILSTVIAVTSGFTLALPATAKTNRRRISIQNLGPDTLAFGSVGITAGSGQWLLKGQELAKDLGAAAVLYGISITAGMTCDVRIFEES